jgi:hypothetical protein
MNITNIIGAALIAVAVLVVGFFLYQQDERHFAESQRWLEVCKKQFEERVLSRAEQISNDESLPEEVRKQAKLGIDAYDQDYLYSQCYKEWHAGE